MITLLQLYSMITLLQLEGIEHDHIVTVGGFRT